MAAGALRTRSELTVGGMTCAGCASRVQTALADMTGVSDARVNFATARATVIHDGEVGDASLVAAIEALGYTVETDGDRDRSEQTRAAGLRTRFLVSTALTVPAMVLSMVPGVQFAGWRWLVAALVTPVVFWPGMVFHQKAWVGLRHRTLTMDTLVSLGTLAAWTWSSVALLRDAGGHVYFETAGMIVTLILLGRWIETSARRRSGAAIRALVELGVPEAELVDGRWVATADLQVGDHFVVRPGGKIACDGQVVDGRAAVDFSMVTGESVPVDVGPGDEVIGATVCTDGTLTVEATQVGSQTALAQIIALVEAAQGGRAEIQRLADRIASVFVPIVILVSLATLASWLLFGGSTSEAVTAAVAVLIISCPCALGLATPLGVLVGTGRGAELGIIIKGGEVLEDTRRVETVVFDKTGTLTTGVMTLIDQFGDRQLLADVAVVEARSEHPIARGIVEGMRSLGVVVDASQIDPESFRAIAGEGVVGTVEHRPVRVGRRALFATVEPDLEARATEAMRQGRTVVYAGRTDTVEAVLVVGDQPKPSSAAAVAALTDAGMATVLLTGDTRATAEAVAAAVGISEVFAEVLPDEKAAVIQRLRDQGRRVAMVGDGINDAPALATADLGIALGTGTDVAMEASDLTIVSGDLRGVVDAIALSRRTLSTIKGNLFWAFTYNAAAIPLAAVGVLNPMIASAAMGCSSIFVVSNSLRLRRFAGSR
jgi:Cu+-exporting ATPase